MTDLIDCQMTDWIDCQMTDWIDSKWQIELAAKWQIELTAKWHIELTGKREVVITDKWQVVCICTVSLPWVYRTYQNQSICHLAVNWICHFGSQFNLSFGCLFVQSFICVIDYHCFLFGSAATTAEPAPQMETSHNTIRGDAEPASCQQSNRSPQSSHRPPWCCLRS